MHWIHGSDFSMHKKASAVKLCKNKPWTWFVYCEHHWWILEAYCFENFVAFLSWVFWCEQFYRPFVLYTAKIVCHHSTPPPATSYTLAPSQNSRHRLFSSEVPIEKYFPTKKPVVISVTNNNKCCPKKSKFVLWWATSRESKMKKIPGASGVDSHHQVLVSRHVGWWELRDNGRSRLRGTAQETVDSVRNPTQEAIEGWTETQGWVLFLFYPFLLSHFIWQFMNLH